MSPTFHCQRMMTMADTERIRATKKELIRLRKSKDDAKRKKHHTCFWTWPWGHLWKPGPLSFTEVCEVCGKVEWRVP